MGVDHSSGSLGDLEIRISQPLPGSRWSLFLPHPRARIPFTCVGLLPLALGTTAVSDLILGIDEDDV